MKTGLSLKIHHVHPHIHACLLLILLFLAGTAIRAAERPLLPLVEGDCPKCHSYKIKKIKNAGGKHAEVACLDCHPRQHVPEKGSTVAACENCHFEQPHYEIKDCLHCHADPHMPMATLRDPVKPARVECLSCHGDVGKEMQQAEGAHAQLYCTRCHKRHEYLPECLDCHNPHMRSQPAAACKRCHRPHNPQQVNPAGWVPAIFCGACHRKEREYLASTTSKHSVITCVYCHEGPHPSKPRCHDCHVLPHDLALHRQYRGCLSDCHGDAHRLVSKK
jgi:hypothetical protein